MGIFSLYHRLLPDLIFYIWNISNIFLVAIANLWAKGLWLVQSISEAHHLTFLEHINLNDTPGYKS